MRESINALQFHQIRDNDPLGTDAMIGRTTIDLEQRLIHKMERGVIVLE